jgi:hypothetical protein
MLKGKAKVDYMRDYMRRKRAGQVTRNPRPPYRRKRSEYPPLVFCAVCGDARWLPEGPIFVEWDQNEPICEKCADKASELVAEARGRRP